MPSIKSENIPVKIAVSITAMRARSTSIANKAGDNKRIRGITRRVKNKRREHPNRLFSRVPRGNLDQNWFRLWINCQKIPEGLTNDEILEMWVKRYREETGKTGYFVKG